MILETVERNRDRIHCFARKISSGFILLSEENNENKLAYRRESMNWIQALRRARVSSRAWSNEVQKYVSILQYLKRCPRYKILNYLVEQKGWQKDRCFINYKNFQVICEPIVWYVFRTTSKMRLRSIVLLWRCFILSISVFKTSEG